MKFINYIESFIKKSRDVNFKDILSFFGFLIALPVSYLFKIKHPKLWLICEYENEEGDNDEMYYENDEEFEQDEIEEQQSPKKN